MAADDSNAMVITPSNMLAAAMWCGGKISEERDAFDDEKVTRSLNVPTLNGVERAYVGDVLMLDGDSTVFFKIVRGVTNIKPEGE